MIKFAIFPTIGAFLQPLPQMINTAILGRFQDPLYLASLGLGMMYIGFFGQTVFITFNSMTTVIP
jgi:Na+-driven multidrug efflux pump